MCKFCPFFYMHRAIWTARGNWLSCLSYYWLNPGERESSEIADEWHSLESMALENWQLADLFHADHMACWWLKPVNKAWTVYILICRDNSLYCGITKNLSRRIRQHNGLISGGAKYTACRRPVALAACLDELDQSTALKLEIQIKQLPKNKKLIFFDKICQG